MSTPERFILDRPRDLGGLLNDTLTLYGRHFLKFLAMALVAVVPVYAAVLGVGLEQFKGDFDSKLSPGEVAISSLVSFLVVGPLVAVMALHALRELADERRPGAGRSIVAGFDAFSIVFWPVLIALVGAASTFLLVIVPFVLLLRWFFVPQLVVVEGKRGTEALRASWELTRGQAWRAAGLIILAYALFRLGSALLATPIAIAGKEFDSAALGLAATTFADVLAAAPIGIFAALLYFDLKSRQAALRR